MEAILSDHMLTIRTTRNSGPIYLESKMLDLNEKVEPPLWTENEDPDLNLEPHEIAWSRAINAQTDETFDLSYTR